MQKQNKDKKFYFDTNFFDVQEEDTEDVLEEELPPPPPTFSEEELEAAKKQGFEAGKKEGHEQEKQSTERMIAKSLQAIEKKFDDVFTSESLRENQYEKEALSLGLMLFQKLFPSLNKRYGMEEIKAVIQDVLSSHNEKTTFKIETKPETKEKLENFFNETVYKDRLNFSGDDSLAHGECIMRWEDGGAIRNVASLVQVVEKELSAILELETSDKDLENKDLDKKDLKNEDPKKEDKENEENKKSEDDLTNGETKNE